MTLLFDLDGRDANFGLRYHSKYFEIDVAAVKLEQMFADNFSPRLAFGFYGLYPFAREKPRMAIVAGTVKDAETNDVLSGYVSMENLGMPAANTAAGTGYYKLTSIPPGMYTFIAGAPGYETAKKVVTLKPGEFVALNFSLNKPRPKLGGLMGSVSDRKSLLPLVADLTLTPVLSQTPVGQVRSTESGSYAFQNLPAGSYKLACRAQGYADQFIDVRILEAVMSTQDILMLKAGMVISFRGIKFDFNKSTIKPESAPILDEAASILENNPDIRVEVQGHTDNVGGYNYNMRLSRDRAAAVVNYMISVHSIDASRLVSKGFGYTQPVAPNATEEGRAQNRRVDFVILK